MERLKDKILTYFEAYHYAKRNDCPVEIPFDDDICIRFEIINKCPVWYTYTYRTGNTEPIDNDELKSLFPEGYINENFRISTSFAKVVNRKKGE